MKKGRIVILTAITVFLVFLAGYAAWMEEVDHHIKRHLYRAASRACGPFFFYNINGI